jgi:uncharacterized protein YyaL (SSP411 family)
MALAALRHRIAVATLVLGLVVWPLSSPPAAGDNAGRGVPTDTATGQYRYTNRLINSNDPYLLLHAHNPVDWYPWGPEALAKAQKEDKPIFVSIGYSTCFWCHVAERLIYPNPEIAELMNQWFVNIKVDREQRPDVDRVYMLATEIMTRHGGWPNNVFLTPDGKPFFAGSYFPPKDDPAVGTGFPTILTALHGLWAEHREDKVVPTAEKVFQAMQRVQKGETAGSEAPVEPAKWLAHGSEALQQRFDPQNGGLGERGPKFPQAPSLKLLLVDYRLNHDPASLDQITRTLDAMAFGGIHDQLAGGFHRYSTEPTWSIPHFEKMLYDNAQLLRLYAEAFETTGLPLYRSVAFDVGQYLRREMMAPEGGFFTSQDSQVNGAEGAAYLWTRDEIGAVLGEERYKKFLAVYTLRPVPNPGVPIGSKAANQQEGGVLRVRLPVSDTLTRAGFSDAAQMLSSLAPERAELLSARGRREQPARDEKIITGLNGLAIAALAESAAILKQPDFLTWARMAAERLWALAYDAQTGALQHEVYHGHAQTNGYLQDYAMLGDAFMALFDATQEGIWRDRAAAIADGLLGRFAHPDGALSTTLDEKNLLIPISDGEDSDVPSGTSAAIDLLLRLAAATGDMRYNASAARIVRHLSGQFQDHPEVWPAAVAALNLHPLKNRESAATADPRTPTAGAPSKRAAFHIPETADHVHASAVLKAGPNDDEVIVTLKVDDGYHINANPASFDYLIPTSVAFDRLQPSKVDYPSPVRFKSAFAPDGLDVYEGGVALIATFPKGSLEGNKDIQGAATAQACNSQICLPPSKLSVSLSGRNE